MEILGEGFATLQRRATVDIFGVKGEKNFIDWPLAALDGWKTFCCPYPAGEEPTTKRNPKIKASQKKN